MTQAKHQERIFTKIAKIANFFKRSPFGAFTFCACDDRDLVRQLNTQVIEQGRQMGLTVKEVFLSSDNLNNFLGRIRLGLGGETDGALVVNFDELIRLSGGEAVQQINFARENLVDMGKPMVIWLSEENISLMANRAPDLFTRRGREVISFSDVSFGDELAWLESTIKEQAKLESVLPPEVVQTTLVALRMQRNALQSMIKAMEQPQTYDAQVNGSGSIAQDGSAAAGKRGVAVRGDMNESVFVTGNGNTVEINKDNPPETPEEALNAYCRLLFREHRRLPLRGLELGASDPGSEAGQMALDRVYVDLNTRTQVKIEEGEGSEKDEAERFGREETRPLRTLEAVIQNKQLVILGDPGSGKSTFVNHLSLCLSGHRAYAGDGWLGHLDGWPGNEDRTIPILVILRDFARWLPEDEEEAGPVLLWEFIRSRLEARQLEFAVDPLRTALSQGEILLLLDGLDEIPTRKQRIQVRDVVAAFAERHEDCRIVVTCRVMSYQNPKWQLAGFPVVELAPLNQEMAGRFIDGWHGELMRLGQMSRDKGANMAERLKGAVKKPDLWRLAVNPLLLTVMALVNTHKGRLPDARARLYEETVDILLWRWDQIKSAGEKTLPRLSELLQNAGQTEMDLKRELWRLAYEAHGESGGNGEDGLADIKEWQLIQALKSIHPEESMDWAAQVIETIKVRAGLLLERVPGVYYFPHRMFQEYLAGSHLSVQGNFAEAATGLMEAGHLWREVILLAVGRLVNVTGEIDKAIALVGELANSPLCECDADWWKIWMAGDLILEIRLERMKRRALGRGLVEQVRKRLVDLLEAGALQPKERVEAGNTLSRIGDPRFDPDFYYLPKEDGEGVEALGFVKISAGEFLMGSDKKVDSEALDSEIPQHTVFLSEYWIARYPVTVAQYKIFAEETGQELNDGWRKNNRFENHPVVVVSWHDAQAYCEWLTEKFQERGRNVIVSLPTEAQWEKAARGTEGRIYPWGNEKIEPDRANYYDTGIGSTSSVGCFPAGKTTLGLTDMIGNVWEWCYDWYGNYRADSGDDPTGPEDGSSRVGRGGSWFGGAGGCRAACRGRGGPGDRGVILGFRLVLATRSATRKEQVKHPGSRI